MLWSYCWNFDESWFFLAQISFITMLCARNKSPQRSHWYKLQMSNCPHTSIVNHQNHWGPLAPLLWMSDVRSIFWLSSQEQWHPSCCVTSEQESVRTGNANCDGMPYIVWHGWISLLPLSSLELENIENRLCFSVTHVSSLVSVGCSYVLYMGCEIQYSSGTESPHNLPCLYVWRGGNLSAEC